MGRRADLGAAGFQLAAQIGIDDRVHHHAGIGLDLLEHPFHLPRGTHQGIKMFERMRALELGDGSPHHFHQRLARGIGDHMDVETGLETGGRRNGHGVGSPSITFTIC